MTEDVTPRLSLTDWAVLGLVDEEPRHGFAAARELKEGGPIGQVWTVARPLVYRALDHLQACGLVEAVATEPGAKGPVRTVFHSTGLGRAAVRRWLEQPVEHPRDVRTELMVKFVFCARLGQSSATLVNRQLDRFVPVAAGLAEKAEHAVGPDRVVALWRFENLRAITRVLETMRSWEGDPPPHG